MAWGKEWGVLHHRVPVLPLNVVASSAGKASMCVGVAEGVNFISRAHLWTVLQAKQCEPNIIIPRGLLCCVVKLLIKLQSRKKSGDRHCSAGSIQGKKAEF